MYRKTQLDILKEEDQNVFLNVVEKYKYHDTFKCGHPFKMKDHFHTDNEVRYFLSGHAKFIVGGEVIECRPGTLLEIGKNVVHSFEYDGGTRLEVKRFFESEEEYKEFYVEN